MYVPDGFVFMDSVESVWSEMFCLTNVLFEHQPPAHRQQFRQGVVKNFQMYKYEWVGWGQKENLHKLWVCIDIKARSVGWMRIFIAKGKTQYPNDVVQHFQWVQVADVRSQKQECNNLDQN